MPRAGSRATPRDVLVEAREEAEAVFTGQIEAAACRGAGGGDAARLAAERGRLEDGDLEAAFDQLVRGGRSGHPAAEDRDPASAGVHRRCAAARLCARRDRQGCGPERAEGGEDGAAGHASVGLRTPVWLRTPV